MISAAAEAHVSAAAERFVDEWQACCRIPSVSGALEPIAAAADWIERRIAPLVDEVRRIEIPGYGPLLVAELRGTSDERLLVYNHYDVQPPGDPDQWTSPAFAAELRDGAMYARGACDDKADVTARIQALEAWRTSFDGPPPFGLVFLFDPAEEIGSPGLEDALIAHADELRADACLWESFLRDADGRPGIGFGCRGSLQVELRLKPLRSDQHTAFAAVLRSAPLELMRAVTSMIEADGQVRIAGFHDAVRTPTADEVAAAAALPLPGDAVTLPDVRPYLPGSEEELAQRLVFAPSMSVAEMLVGADGVGAVPAEAAVSVRFGLVPDQEPDVIVAAIRAHLDAHGFDEVEIGVSRSISPARSPIDTPFARATIEAARDVFGEPAVYPVLIGAGPGRMFLDHLGTPVVSPAGTLRPDGNMHGPDEHGSVVDYLDHVRFTVRLFERLAESGLRPRD